MTAARSFPGEVVQTPEELAKAAGTNDREVRVTIAGIECLALHDFNCRTWVNVRRLCLSLGIDPRGQQERIQDPAECDQHGVEHRSAPSEGGEQAALCLELKHSVNWLGGTSKKSCKPEARLRLRAVAAEIVSTIGVAIHGPATPAPQLTPGQILALTATGIEALEHQTAALSVALVGVHEEQAVQAEGTAALKEGDVEAANAFTLRGYLTLVGYKIAGTTDEQRSVRAMVGKALKKVAKENCVALPTPVENSRDGTNFVFPYPSPRTRVPLVEEATARKSALVLKTSPVQEGTGRRRAG